MNLNLVSASKHRGQALLDIARTLSQEMGQSLVARGAILTFGLRIYGAAIALLTQILLARTLGAEELGVYVFAWTWVSLIAFLTPLGFDTASVRFIPTYQTQGRWDLLRGLIRYTFVIAGLCAVLCMGLGYGIVFLSTEPESSVYRDAVMLALLMAPLLTVLRIFEVTARGFSWITWAHLPSYGIRPTLFVVLCLAVFFLWGDPSAEKAMLAAIVSCLLTLAVQWRAHNQQLPRQVKDATALSDKRYWLVTAMPLLLASSFEMVLENTDLIMLGLLQGPLETGIYNAGLRISGCLLFVLFAVQAFSAPKIAKLYAEENREEMIRFVRQARFWIFLPTIAGALVIVIGGDFLLSLFGQEFRNAYPAMLILIGAIVVRAAMGPIDSLLIMTGHQKPVALCLGVAALLNLIVNALLIPRYGIFGAALATCMSTLIEAIVLSFIATRKHGLVPFLLLTKQDKKISPLTES